MTFVENGMETKLLGATLTEQEPASPIGWGSANFLLVARKLLSTSALMVSWPLVDWVHGTLLVCSFHQIILIITKLFGTRTAHRNERKSRDFLRVKISRFTAVYDKT